MKLFYLWLTIYFTFTCCDNDRRSRWRPTYGHPLPVPQDVMVDTVNYVGLALLKAHNQNNINNNIALSPYGATSVLAVLSEGVQGIAFDEILRASFLPHDVVVTRIGLRDIHRHLKSYFIPQEGFLAGLTFSHSNITLKSSYEDLLKFYGYDIESFNTPFYSGTTSTVPESTTEKIPATFNNEATITTSATDSTQPFHNITPAKDYITETVTGSTSTPVTKHTTVEITTKELDVQTVTVSPTVQSTVKTVTDSTQPFDSITLPEATTAEPVTVNRSTPATKGTTIEMITKALDVQPVTISPTVYSTVKTGTDSTQPFDSTTPPKATTAEPVTVSRSTPVTKGTTIKVITKALDVQTVSISPTVHSTEKTGTDSTQPFDSITPPKATTAEPVTESTNTLVTTGTTTETTTKLSDIQAVTVTQPVESTVQTFETTQMPTTVSNSITTQVFKTETPTTSTVLQTTITTQTINDDKEPKAAAPSSENLVTTTSGTTELFETSSLTTIQSITSEKNNADDIISTTVHATQTKTTIAATTQAESDKTSITLSPTTLPPLPSEATITSVSLQETTVDSNVAVTEGITTTSVPVSRVTIEGTQLTSTKETTAGTTESVQQTATEKTKIISEGSSNSPQSTTTENAETEVPSTTTDIVSETEPPPTITESSDESNKATLSEDLVTTTMPTENTKKRSARSILDYLIAKYHDELPQYGSGYQYEPAQPTTFAVHGKTREPNISFMTYDTILPFRYIPYLNAAALVFPLDSTNYYLLLVLPNNIIGIDDLINNMMATTLKQIIFDLQPTRIKATIPSFMLKGRVVLTPSFQQLGICQIFEPRHADFSPMTDDKDIYVTNIEQAITVTIRNYVDPATLQNGNDRFQHRGPVQFIADHPFLYFVMDARIHVALMAGKITNPLNSIIR